MGVFGAWGHGEQRGMGGNGAGGKRLYGRHRGQQWKRRGRDGGPSKTYY